MDSGAAVTPPYVAGPFRLEPFRALMLAPVAGRRPGLGPAPSRDPTATSPTGCAAGSAQGHLRHDDAPALYLHEYTAGGLTVRGLVGALDVSHRATDPDDRAVLPARGDPPRPGRRARRPDGAR